MAFFTIKNVAIKGISACVPKNKEGNNELSFLSNEEIEKLIATTGIESRRVSTQEICTSDLCLAAAEQLIKDLNWSKDEIDALIFVTQTPDYPLPATSCLLQYRLGLKQDCYAMDVSLGCSGWIYGLSTISSLLSSSGLKKGLLLAGDTISKICSNEDKSTYPLFGDAGTATAVEWAPNADFKFHVSSDGSGYDTIIVPDGTYRNMVNQNSFIPQVIEKGIMRNKLQLVLDGMNVFSFGISQAPESVNRLISHFDIDKENIDYFIFHQANRFMNEKIRKKIKIQEEKVPYSLKKFGNTSSATIPLTIVTELKEQLESSKKEIIACGFGVGLSWGSVYFNTDKIVISPLIEL
jgi:3-oxoacyl-[acyl-carrier-protein] synthase-3